MKRSSNKVVNKIVVTKGGDPARTPAVQEKQAVNCEKRVTRGNQNTTRSYKTAFHRSMSTT